MLYYRCNKGKGNPLKKGIDIMTKKMTKRDLFNLAIAETTNPTLIAFFNHELELLDRKNSSNGDRKPTANQVENERLKTIIVDFLVDSGKAYTVTDMIKACEDLSNLTNQKVSRMANDLVEDNKIVKFSEKRKTYFKA
jgi:hypothetical protein